MKITENQLRNVIRHEKSKLAEMKSPDGRFQTSNFFAEDLKTLITGGLSTGLSYSDIEEEFRYALQQVRDDGYEQSHDAY
jgi:hypothetical protein